MPAGSLVRPPSTPSRACHSFGFSRTRLKYRDSAPTLGAIDIPLSLSTTTIGVPWPAGLVDGLEGDPAGQRPVADDRDDVPVGSVAAAHRLLDPDRVADRRRGVAGAHDVVLGLLDRAERRQAVVLADRVQLVAAAGQHLVRIGLVADVPEDLVVGGVEQRVQRDGDLARAEVGAEVAADLARRCR